MYKLRKSKIRQAMYDVTLKGVRAIIATVEKQ